MGTTPFMTSQEGANPPNVAATPARRLLRGLTRRCARCGSRGIFESWFRLASRCPCCGYQFAREPGFFTGVYLLNYSATAVVLFVVLMTYVMRRGISGPHVALWPFVVAGLASCIALPIAFYGGAASLWAAVDLVTRPLDPDEIAEAQTHRTAPD